MAGIRSEAIAAGRAQVAAGIEKKLEGLCDAVITTLGSEIEAYAKAFANDPAVLSEVRTATRLSLAIVIQAIAEGVDFSPEASRAIGEVARRRTEQGIPLYAVQRAYQIGTRIGWQFTLEVFRDQAFEPALGSEILAEMSLAVMSLSEHLTAAVSSTLLEDAAP